ncbi:glycosyltransferase family 2 protein [Natranaerobius trueperi]|uniref:Glycosyl transferase n=1 Tax=Natranaerobius trueperi TaxID=759412 RepID=A0A226BYJ6_9FIRM|nr:glycosyltransferase family 2 protein [Natranaerobius trueperi]OWZ84005.1 glycosyl transferase [Natranaerobius trueperi]
MKKIDKISVIIPAYNEEDTIQNTIRALNHISKVGEIIVVDDGSLDNTVNKARAMDVKCIKLTNNRGKGRALSIGVDKANFDIVAFVDADLGETAQQISYLINPVTRGETDITIAKFPKSNNGGFGLVKCLAKWGIQHVTGKKVNTALSGQRVLSKDTAKKIIEKECDSKFGIEVGSTIEAIKLQKEIKEVEVQMDHRVTGKDFFGFLHRGKQFVHILKTIINKKIDSL